MKCNQINLMIENSGNKGYATIPQWGNFKTGKYVIKKATEHRGTVALIVRG